MRNKYELDLIIDMNKDSSNPKDTFQWVQKLIKDDGGVILLTTVIGNKRLAYEIEKRKEGYYAVVYFEAEPTIWEELERQLKLNKAILRYMSLKLTKQAIAGLLKDVEPIVEDDEPIVEDEPTVTEETEQTEEISEVESEE